MSWLAKLNIMADSMTKQEAQTIMASRYRYEYENIPYSACDISIITKHFKTIKIRSNLSNTLRQLITGDNIRTYWIKKKNLTIPHKYRLGLMHKKSQEYPNFSTTMVIQIFHRILWSGEDAPKI